MFEIFLPVSGRLLFTGSSEPYREFHSLRSPRKDEVALRIGDDVPIVEEFGELPARIRSSGRMLAIAIHEPRQHSDRYAGQRLTL